MKSLFSLPALVGTFVLAAIAFVAPIPAHAQQPKCRIQPYYPLLLHTDCPNDELCSITLSWIVVYKHPCLQCCIWGEATLECTTGTTNHLLKLCADCGGTNSKVFFCPGTPGSPAEEVILACRDECI